MGRHDDCDGVDDGSTDDEREKDGEALLELEAGIEMARYATPGWELADPMLMVMIMKSKVWDE